MRQHDEKLNPHVSPLDFCRDDTFILSGEAEGEDAFAAGTKRFECLYSGSIFVGVNGLIKMGLYSFHADLSTWMMVHLVNHFGGIHHSSRQTGTESILYWCVNNTNTHVEEHVALTPALSWLF